MCHGAVWHIITFNNVLASNLVKFWWSSTWVDRHMLCFDGGKKRAVDVLFDFLQFFILKCNVRHLNIFIGFYTGQKDTLNGISWFFRRRRVRYSLYALTHCSIVRVLSSLSITDLALNSLIVNGGQCYGFLSKKKKRYACLAFYSCSNPTIIQEKNYYFSGKFLLKFIG